MAASPARRARLPDADVSKATRKLRMLRTLACDLTYEQAVLDTGAQCIAGVDEVGRGALFGPVVAAAVVLPRGEACTELMAEGLRDSKQLEPEARERLAVMVRACAVALAIAEVDAETIDRINIYQATKVAMLRAVEALAPAPDHLLIDALRIAFPCPQTPIIYGDSKCLSIAAASVVAKVYRDARMCEMARDFPLYGLADHKGYSTPEHQRALLRHGPSRLHRRTFRPVWEACLPWDEPFSLD